MGFKAYICVINPGSFRDLQEIVLKITRHIHCGVMKLRKHGRHALLSRGWGKQDKRSIEPFR